MVWKRRNRVAAGPFFVKWVCCKHRPYYFHDSILFVWGSLFCWKSKRWYVICSQSQANACKEVCSPADNVHTVRAPSQESNSISHTKVVFHFILSKKKCLFLKVQCLNLLVEYFISNSGLCIEDLLSFYFSASLFLLAD